MALYLGMDVSTQGVKCVLVDTDRDAIAAESAVHFGQDLPAYASPDGYLPDGAPLVRHADPRMWLDGLELALERLRDSGAPMAGIAGLSGSAQQHGSVYMASPFSPWLGGMRLSEQLPALLSRRTAPIWMDHSTGTECRELTARFGERLRRDTGSPAIERFTGPQIRKFSKESPGDYRSTRRIHLVSSFLCSVLCGSDAPIDHGDGTGMNLLDLATWTWSGDIASFTAPGLPGKLPAAAPSATVAGALDPYFTRYGLLPGIPVVAWSGDNPGSLVGMGASAPGMAGISLGTSDTFFASMPAPRLDPGGCGHLFGHPGGGFMGLTCFSNGSLARESVRNALGVDWTYFGETACAATEAGNGGRLMLPYFAPENTPPVSAPGVRRNYAHATAAEEIRALLESQALRMRLHSEWMGMRVDRLRLAGGASRAAGFHQIIADVFQATVEGLATVNAAGLGAAMRAASMGDGVPLELLAERLCRPARITRPRPETERCYVKMLEELACMERTA